MLDFFRRLVDQGEDRSFQYREEFYAGPSGAFHNAANVEINASTCALIADAFFAAGQEWARKGAELQRRDRKIVDGQLYESMISGR